jgi:hypothetical protein
MHDKFAEGLTLWDMRPPSSFDGDVGKSMPEHGNTATGFLVRLGFVRVDTICSYHLHCPSYQYFCRDCHCLENYGPISRVKSGLQVTSGHMIVWNLSPCEPKKSGDESTHQVAVEAVWVVCSGEAKGAPS